VFNFKTTVTDTSSRGLRSGLAADSLQGMLVRTPEEHRYLSLVSVVCCQVVVYAADRSLD